MKANLRTTCLAVAAAALLSAPAALAQCRAQRQCGQRTPPVRQGRLLRVPRLRRPGRGRDRSPARQDQAAVRRLPAPAAQAVEPDAALRGGGAVGRDGGGYLRLSSQPARPGGHEDGQAAALGPPRAGQPNRHGGRGGALANDATMPCRHAITSARDTARGHNCPAVRAQAPRRLVVADRPAAQAIPQTPCAEVGPRAQQSGRRRRDAPRLTRFSRYSIIRQHLATRSGQPKGARNNTKGATKRRVEGRQNDFGQVPDQALRACRNQKRRRRHQFHHSGRQAVHASRAERLRQVDHAAHDRGHRGADLRRDQSRRPPRLFE